MHAGPMYSLTDLRAATEDLLATLDAVPDDDFAQDSLLPDWTIGHVAGHVALNSEGLARAARGLLDGVPRTMYDSNEVRAADIAELAAATPTQIRQRVRAGADDLHAALSDLHERTDLLGTEILRTPDGERRFRGEDVAWMRAREIYIHHADLGLSYTRHDWPEAFWRPLIEQFARKVSARLVAGDVNETWQADVVGPTVRGTAADLAWWLTGRPAGDGLDSDSGELPRIEAW